MASARGLDVEWGDTAPAPTSRPTSRRRAAPQRGPAKAPVRSDVYTGLLALALLAQIAGAVFLFLDYKEYPEGKAPPEVKMSAPSAGKPAPAADKGGDDKGGEKGGENK